MTGIVQLGKSIVETMGFNRNSKCDDFLSAMKRILSIAQKKETVSFDSLASPSGELSQEVDTFMTLIGAFYLDNFEITKKINEVNTYFNQQKSILKQVKTLIESHYVVKLEANLQLSFEVYEEWLSICKQRTNIEAFNKLFENLIDTIDVDDINEDMQHRSNDVISIKDQDKPKKVPDAFWWYN